MTITKTTVKVRDLVKGFSCDKATNRVVGYDGKLDIRPAYQREFVYKPAQKVAVINSILHNLPLNVIYWVKTGPDTFEVLDGQQRILSICEYVDGAFNYNMRYFQNLLPADQNTLLDYELDVYQCEGTDQEKLEWFKIINIAGVKLTDQELRNAVYAGPWLSAAKKKFSAKNCSAEQMGGRFMSGSPIRQDFLETALSWIAAREGTTIEDYMAQHQNDPNAGALWAYFSAVIEWVKQVFPHYRKEMKSVQWGLLYNEYGNQFPDTDLLEQEVSRLMMDEDVTNKKGIYDYVLSGAEKALNIRAFSPNMKREAYERQDGKCPHCTTEGVDKVWEIENMEADHCTPWHDGGKTTADNCVMLCKRHNRSKGGR